MPNPHLAVYLNDHAAGSVVALELLEATEKAHAGTDLGRFLGQLRADILDDRRELDALMERLGVSPSVPRRAMAWLGEKFTELKLRLDDPSGGPFRLLEVLDALSAGIEGKRSLWAALAAAAGREAALRGPDYTRLQARAEEQRSRLEPVRLRAAAEALV